MRRFGFLLCALVAVVSFAAKAADSALSPAANAAFLAANANKPGVVVMRDGLQYRILHNGFGGRLKHALESQAASSAAGVAL